MWLLGFILCILCHGVHLKHNLDCSHAVCVIMNRVKARANAKRNKENKHTHVTEVRTLLEIRLDGTLKYFLNMQTDTKKPIPFLD